MLLKISLVGALIHHNNKFETRLIGIMKKKIIAFVALVLIGIVFYNFSKIPNRNDIPGGFDEVAYIRNENNQGTILLYYAFTVADTTNADYLALGKTLPFNKSSGITTAFMFDKTKPAPISLSLAPPHYDTLKFKPIGVYVIDKVGNRNFKVF